MKPADLGLPAAVTWAQLWHAVGPFMAPVPGARDSLRDLWLLGAPLPDNRPGLPPRRVLLVGRFQAWWHEWYGRASAPRDRRELGEWRRR